MYGGPTAAQSNLCQCNTVVYSLVSACAACQGSSSILFAFHFIHMKCIPIIFYQVVRLVGQLHYRVFPFDVSVPFTSGPPILCRTYFLIISSETISVTDIRTQFLMERAYPTGHILMWRSVSLYILRDLGGSENITFA